LLLNLCNLLLDERPLLLVMIPNTKRVLALASCAPLRPERGVRSEEMIKTCPVGGNGGIKEYSDAFSVIAD